MDFQLYKYLESLITEQRRDLFAEILTQRTRHFTVVTEDVYQLHNTSAVMRSCDIFGIQDLHVVEEVIKKRIDKEIAMGSQKWVNLYRYNNVDDCISDLRNKGYQIVATVPHGTSTALKDFDITRKSAFFFGKESVGLSDKVMENTDVFLKIPMYGFTESLNISVAAAIVLQHVVTALRETDVDWQLSEDEKLHLTMQWMQKTIKSVDQIIERYYSDH